MDKVTVLARKIAMVLFSVVQALSLDLNAQPQKATEHDVEAAYLLNFLKFIQWPASVAGASNTIGICVLGRDPFGSVLDMLVAGQQIDGRTVMVRRLAGTNDLAGCRVVFIDSSENARLPMALAALDSLPVLTVSNIPDFISRGGMIQFVLKENRVRFEINVANAERVGLSLSARLLNVALSVRRS